LGGAQLKNVKKIFLFCSPKRNGGGRKRWAGFSPQNPLDFAQRKFGFRPIDTTKIYLQRDLPRSGLRPARRSVAEERAGDFKL